MIRPGQGVGPINLGQSLAQVKGLLGPPVKVLKSPNDPNAKFLSYPQHKLAVFVGSNGVVIGVTVLGGPWCTPEGIRVGASKAAVMKVYGQGLVRGQGNINYADKGIAFSYNSGSVCAIYVQKIEDSKALLGDRLIMPGQRCGSIKIGMPANAVVQAWGQPDNVLQLQGGSCIYQYKEEMMGFIVRQNQISGMVIETGDFITSHGIKVGSAKSDVLRIFGPCQEADSQLIYDKKGIGFRILDGRVQQITVLPKD
ncbi:hypothetical protein IJT17_04625 [bacterium]|nr:hypothetical protein [bacterium]